MLERNHNEFNSSGRRTFRFLLSLVLLVFLAICFLTSNRYLPQKADESHSEKMGSFTSHAFQVHHLSEEMSTSTPPPKTTYSESQQSPQLAELKGRVTLAGKPESEFEFTSAACCPDFESLVSRSTRHYALNADRELADVIVFISDGLDSGTFLSPSQPLMLDQLACEFTPYILAVQTGQPLFIRNSDPCIRNIWIIPHVPGNSESIFWQRPGETNIHTVVFAQPEIFITIRSQSHY